MCIIHCSPVSILSWSLFTDFIGVCLHLLQVLGSLTHCRMAHIKQQSRKSPGFRVNALPLLSPRCHLNSLAAALPVWNGVKNSLLTGRIKRKHISKCSVNHKIMQNSFFIECEDFKCGNMKSTTTQRAWHINT